MGIPGRKGIQVAGAWALAVLFSANAQAATLHFDLLCPSMNMDCAYVDTDSGQVQVAGSSLTDLKEIVIRGRRCGEPVVDIGVVPAVGAEGTWLHFDVAITDSMTRAATGSLYFSPRDYHGNESCHPWEYTFSLPQFIAPPPIPGSGGLRGEYYSSTAWSNFVTFLMERTDSTVNFDWGLGAPFSGGPVDYFSLRESGTLLVPVAGIYTLSLAHDDGGRLWIDGAVVIDAWVSGNAEHFATLTLSAGPHPIKVEIFEGYGGARGVLSWSGPGITKQVIPKGALMP